MIFVVIAGAVAYQAALDTSLSEVQINIACAALKAQDHNLFAGDGVFGGSRLWLFHTPMFQSVMNASLIPTGFADPTLPFRILAGMTALLFLCGMYALLYRQTLSWKMSAFVAVMAMTVTTMLGGAIWGVGPLKTITPPTIFHATTPLIVLAYLHYEKRWQIVLVFAFIGLMGNLHLVTAMNLTLILLMTYLARQRFAASAWPVAAACAVTSLTAAVPYALYYFGVRHLLGGDTAAAASPDAIAQAFQVSDLALFYPALFKSMLRWDFLVRVLALSVIAAMVLLQLERFRVRDGRFWLSMIVSCVVVALGFQGLSQVVGHVRGEYPPVVDFLRASALVMLPLYVLLAQGLVNLSRLWRAHRRLLGWTLALMGAAWIMPSDNFSSARRHLYAMTSHVIKEQVQPSRFAALEEQKQRRQELRAMALWARGEAFDDYAEDLANLVKTLEAKGTATTAPTTEPAENDAPPPVAVALEPPPPFGQPLFLTDQVEFRLHSRRAILAAPEDMRFLYYLTPGRLDEWVRRYAQQQRILAGASDNTELAVFFGHLALQHDLANITDFYIVLDATVAAEKYPALDPVTSRRWGKFWRLYRVNLENLEALPKLHKPREAIP